MSRSAFDTHTEPLFKNFEILNLESIYKLQIGNLCINTNTANFLIASIVYMFLVTRQVHCMALEFRSFFILPQGRTNI